MKEMEPEETHSRSKLSVDLDELAKVGATYLPNLANIHGDAARRIHRSAIDDGRIFRVPGTAGTEVSPALAHYQAVRDLLQNILRETTMNLNGAGTGILRIVEMYGGTDAENTKRVDVPIPPAPGDPIPPKEN